jgi:hypothetical protein
VTDKPEPTPGVPADARSDASEEAVVLDLYKLAVEMADRVSARRTTANNFFLALHGSLAAVVALIGTQSSAGPQDGTSSSIVPMTVVGAAGILLCAAWWLGLRSYRDLNSAKFQVITKLEERLPAAVFSTEWKFLKRDEIPWWRGRYAEQGTVERVVPFIFMALYAFAIWRTMTG